MTINDTPLRMRIEVKNGGWSASNDQAIFVMDVVERDASISGKRKLQGHGVQSTELHVDCGKTRVVVAEFPAEIVCRARVPPTLNKPVHFYLKRGEPPYFCWGDPPSQP
jgi:hypothetical protein